MALLGSEGGYSSVTTFRSAAEMEEERKRRFAKTWEDNISVNLKSFRETAQRRVADAMKRVEGRRVEFGRSQLAQAHSAALERFNAVESSMEATRNFRDAALPTLSAAQSKVQEFGRSRLAQARDTALQRLGDTQGAMDATQRFRDAALPTLSAARERFKMADIAAEDAQRIRLGQQPTADVARSFIPEAGGLPPQPAGLGNAQLIDAMVRPYNLKMLKESGATLLSPQEIELLKNYPADLVQQFLSAGRVGDLVDIGQTHRPTDLREGVLPYAMGEEPLPGLAGKVFGGPSMALAGATAGLLKGPGSLAFRAAGEIGGPFAAYGAGEALNAAGAPPEVVIPGQIAAGVAGGVGAGMGANAGVNAWRRGAAQTLERSGGLRAFTASERGGTGLVGGEPPDIPTGAPWQMTRAEFNQEALYRGVGESTATGRNTYWTNRLALAKMHTGTKDSPRIRIALQRAVHPDLLGDTGSVDAAIREGEQLGAQGLYIPEGYDLPVVAEVPSGVDPHRFIVEQAVREGKPVPPNVLAEYPDISTGIGGGKPPKLSSVSDAAQAAARLPTDMEVPFPRPSTLRTVDEIASDVYNSTRNAAGGLARIAGKAPPLRGIVHAVNPSALVGEPPASWVTALGREDAERFQAILVAYERKLDMGSSLMNVAETGINQRARAVGFSLKDGQLANKSGILGPLGDVAENVSRYPVTPAQRQFLDQIDELLKQAHAAEKFAGVESGEIFSGEGRYFPRKVEAVAGVKKVGGTRTNMGATQGFQKGRYYELQQEGIANGLDYSGDIGLTVGLRGRASIKAIADKEFTAAVAHLGHGGHPAVGEMGTSIPGFGSLVFPREIAQTLMDTLQPPPTHGLVGAANAGNRFLRAMRATGDLSYSLIQGLSGAATHPVAFAKSVGYGFDSLLLDGRLYGHWVQKNARQIERFVNAGGLMGDSEFTFDNILTNRSLAGLLKRGTSRFDNAFNNSANVNALTHFEGMAGVDAAMGPSWFRKAARVAFGDFTAFKPGATSDEIAASVANKIAGRVSSRSLGVNATMREVESLLAFAPRFYRATFGLLGDAVQGGMRGAEARRSLAFFAAGATAAYIGAARKLGQEPHLDSSKANFFTVTIGGQAIGFGGPMMGLMRTVGTAATNPERLGDWNIRTNPLLKWARGRTAPILGIAIDLASKKTYIGDELKSPEQIGEYLATQPLPFTAQSAVKEGPQSIAPQFMGLRSFPAPEFNPRIQVWDMEEYPGLTAGQAIDIHQFLGRVSGYRTQQFEDWKKADSTEFVIEKLAAKEGLNEHEIAWAKALNKGLDRKPEFIQFLVDNEGALRDRYPFLYDSRDIQMALPGVQAGGK